MKATTLLEQQHRRVEALLNELETSRAKAESKVEELATMLAAHAAVEEELFYPAARRLDKGQVLVSAEEHQIMEFALKRLLATDPEDESFRPRLCVLKEAVQHHVAEEERDLLPQMDEGLGDEDNEALGKQMAARYKELEAGGHEPLLGARKNRRSRDGQRSSSSKASSSKAGSSKAGPPAKAGSSKKKETHAHRSKAA